jgi:hypothetical protein
MASDKLHFQKASAPSHPLSRHDASENFGSESKGPRIDTLLMPDFKSFAGLEELGLCK